MWHSRSDRDFLRLLHEWWESSHEQECLYKSTFCIWLPSHVNQIVSTCTDPSLFLAFRLPWCLHCLSCSSTCRNTLLSCSDLQQTSSPCRTIKSSISLLDTCIITSVAWPTGLWHAQDIDTRCYLRVKVQYSSQGWWCYLNLFSRMFLSPEGDFLPQVTLVLDQCSLKWSVPCTSKCPTRAKLVVVHCVHPGLWGFSARPQMHQWRFLWSQNQLSKRHWLATKYPQAHLAPPAGFLCKPTCRKSHLASSYCHGHRKHCPLLQDIPSDL